MGTAWMDRCIGAERDIRRNNSQITARLACLPSISIMKKLQHYESAGYHYANIPTDHFITYYI